MFIVFIYIIAVFCFLLLVPSAPTISEIKHISSSTVDIKWNKPSHPNGVILGYKLHYKKLSDDNYTDVYVHADVRNIMLTKLGLYYLIFINVPPRILRSACKIFHQPTTTGGNLEAFHNLVYTTP